MLYARVAFDPDGGGSGRGWMAVGRSKINKKQSFANTAGQDGIPGDRIAKGPKSAAAHKTGPRHVPYSHISPLERKNDLSTSYPHALLLTHFPCRAP
jgi:hypothetical protein